MRILVATHPVDFRKGHDGLAALVQSTLKGDPFAGTVFVFRAKRTDRLKILFWETFLCGFDGILQLDDYQGYNRLTRPSRAGGDPIRVAHCWAHARRKLKEVFDRDGSEIAAEGLRRIAEFYKVEADIRGCGPEQRLQVRQIRTAPLVAEFGQWLQQQRLRVSAKSRLGDKLTYIHHQWDGLQAFLQDGRVEIDSNSIENLIRPISPSIGKTPCSRATTRAARAARHGDASRR